MILLIQSEVVGALAVQRALGESRLDVDHLVWVRTLAQGIEQLERGQRGEDAAARAVICDLRLQDSVGIATFEAVRRCSPQIPIVVLGDLEFRHAGKSALHAGAHDFFLKESIGDHAFVDAVERAIQGTGPASTASAESGRAQVTLESIADGVISTDEKGLVTYCNPVAVALTGWAADHARGRPFVDVFRLIDGKSRALLPDPVERSLRANAAVTLGPDSLLVRQDGREIAIEDSTAPLHDETGRIVGAVIVFRDVSAARAAALRMSHLAHHDVLTDLPNRYLFADRLNQAISLAKRRRQMLAVLYLDLDRFKIINDSLGHAIGDRLLQSVALSLVGCVRAMDTVSRQGGDEFVVLLPEITYTEDAAVAADKLLRAVTAPFTIDDRELHVTASIGIVVHPQHGADATTLLKNADAAMYDAKEAGRNNYRFFTQDMSLRATEKQQVEAEMREALELGQFVLHYQPIVALEQGSLVAVEVLVRWRHPSRGMLLPEAFISMAEQCGFVVPLGRWVIREACRQARAWRNQGFPRMRIAVNTSALELRTNGFVKFLDEILGETALAPGDLEIEITETFVLQESQMTEEILGAIADLGVQLSLDDFGTGYSSLNHLKLYPINTLKIDQSFIRELATDASDAIIVRAIIDLATSLSLRVVAEGVETPLQASLLRSLGCVEAQGYYFGRAIGAAAFAEHLEQLASIDD